VATKVLVTPSTLPGCGSNKFDVRVTITDSSVEVSNVSYAVEPKEVKFRAKELESALRADFLEGNGGLRG
jgi:hypothetical protein